VLIMRLEADDFVLLENPSATPACLKGGGLNLSVFYGTV